MAVVVVTRMGARSLGDAGEVMRVTAAVIDGIRVQPGFLGGGLMVAGPRTFFTLTAWRSGRDLAAFGVAHAPVSDRGPELAHDLTAVTWRTEDDAVPTWDQARERWDAGGRAPGRGLRSVLEPAALRTAP